MRLAKVIVDVPTMQTNDPYTYLVPDELSDKIQKGMRVIVPFGNGSRKIQGIIADVDNDGEFDGKLKKIEGILDLEPVLNPELLSLSKWMSKKTYAFQISCILTMLPSVMRAKYQKQLVLNSDDVDDDILKLFDGSTVIDFDVDKLPNDIVRKIIQARKKRQVVIKYKVQDNAKAKKIYALSSKISTDEAKHELENIRKNSKNLIKILQYIISHPGESIAQRKLAKDYDISESSIKTAIQKNWFKRFLQEEYRNPYKQTVKRNYPLKLNDDQANAVNTISDSIEKENDQVYLLEGVTGSGKTEVYLQTIQRALKMGKTALMLVPEISLTPQMVKRVKGRFGDRVAMLHSGLSSGEKYDEWRRIENGEADVVVGARSAIFAPLDNIGVIIMDEEHESSYKQDDAPRYHTRDVAKWRANYHNCPLVLGSATPSLESRARATKGVYTLIRLPHRINNQSLPEVRIIDMKEQMKENGQEDFSNELLAAINNRLQKHEQVVLMLNRRGYSSFVMCRNCGFVLHCPNCDISLTLHMDSRTMKCHYCGHEEPIPNKCRNCGSKKIRYYGTGTQKVQQQLQRLVPNARILRMDVDTTRRKGSHERLLQRFGNGDADILLGTQMIAKGLDFPNVTLVGVLNADTSLDLPDFRSSERTFDLLTQVSGRAGRAEKSGLVYVQTFNPDNYAIQLSKKQDYELFYRKEMSIRHETNYPPYFFTVKITASDVNESKAAAKMFEIAKILKAKLSQQAIMLGPSPSSILKLKNKYYYQIIIKYKHEPNMDECLEYILNHYQKDAQKGLYVNIDPDPLNFM
ncbi:primosomal protein N' [Apilactobacillus bombintestini]|uniref:Replication restart protein PriA n=1 Tax=Apilactobacillus bombintestini TaxID=2419772 RepID=A0A387ATD3_9LACO|nr:primosomal protein N' [Apilactobacillus bombintestini]AYF92609.1 primosomal protein N' [Apilactobacillus bombintestini]